MKCAKDRLKMMPDPEAIADMEAEDPAQVRVWLMHYRLSAALGEMEEALTRRGYPGGDSFLMGAICALNWATGGEERDWRPYGNTITDMLAEMAKEREASERPC